MSASTVWGVNGLQKESNTSSSVLKTDLDDTVDIANLSIHLLYKSLDNKLPLF